jgi:glutaredoxin/glutathione-dependent peroxiredoxin
MAPAFNPIPPATFQIMESGKPVSLTSRELFSGSRVALFGVAGAFIPTCHHLHLPAIIEEFETLKGGGVDVVACTSVNDVYVMDAWRTALRAPPGVLFLADGNGDFARGLGLAFNGRPFGLGERSKRYVMWAIDGAIQQMAVEPDLTLADVSTAHALLGMFESWSAGSP